MYFDVVPGQDLASIYISSFPKQGETVKSDICTCICICKKKVYKKELTNI